jgi:hypothetical protein
MAHFRGTIAGQRGAASRLGSKASGLTVEAQSWQGRVVIDLYHDEKTGQDMAHVYLGTHHGAGVSRTLYDGPVSGQPMPICPDAQDFETEEAYNAALATWEASR